MFELQRKHEIFERDLVALKQSVELCARVQAVELLPSYSELREKEILAKRDQLLLAWSELAERADQRKVLLLDASDLHRFLNTVFSFERYILMISFFLQVKSSYFE